MATVQHVTSLDEAIDLLAGAGKLRAGTVVITDFDNTLVSFGEEARNLLDLRPEAIPDETMYLLDRLVAMGVQVAVATNRPDEGIYLAKKWAKLRGNYNVYPEALEKKGVEVFGGGPFFMVEKYKETDNAVYALRSWLVAPVESGGAGLNGGSALVVCLGDRLGDLSFFEKLEKSVHAHNPEVVFEIYKLPGIAAEENPSPPSGIKERLIKLIARFLP
ncbi:MAG: hypothetical protein N2691_02710 [Patescibacteria group bacterium]|nr:hypothetical protein [Patescibacteria group bacterium]